MIPKGKICTKCKQYKLLDLYCKKGDGKYGKHSQCKACQKIYKDNNRAKNAIKVAEYKEKHREYIREYQNEYKSAYMSIPENRARRNKHNATRRAIIGQASVNWANQEAMDNIYKTAATLEHQDGIKRHVDHIIPLSHKLVCGLHVENNLQILTAEENMRKHNRL